MTLDLVMDGGFASDQLSKPGAAGLTTRVMTDGTDKLDALQISARLSELGASLSANAGRDTNSLDMTTLSARLDPALDLFADVLLHPTFRPEDVDREKALQIAQIDQDKDDPVNMVTRVLPVLVYGKGHAYAAPLDGLGDEASVSALTRADLVADHQTWFRPNAATLVIVGDTTLAAITPKLEARLAGWVAKPLPVKNIAPVNPPEHSRIYLMDKPGALQSVILAGIVAPPRKDPDHMAIEVMNTALGGAFNSRLNMNLREDKHWGLWRQQLHRAGARPGLFIAYAPVETDKTAESFDEMRKELTDIVAQRPISAGELDFAKASQINAMAGGWETSDQVANSLAAMVTYGLPDDYFDTMPARLEAVTAAGAEQAAQRVVKPNQLIWIIAGDRKVIEPKLRALGLEVQPLDADGKPIP